MPAPAIRAISCARAPGSSGTDLSQLTIATDNVDASYLARPRKWDMGMVQRFMFGLGPISSIYDFLTFGVMLWGFHAGPELFRAGWFIESLASRRVCSW